MFPGFAWIRVQLEPVFLVQIRAAHFELGSILGSPTSGARSVIPYRLSSQKVCGQDRHFQTSIAPMT